MKTKILIVAAHPDDEILGCGGTVARLVHEGCEAFTLILGEGATSRSKKRDVVLYDQELKKLKMQAQNANALIGVKKVFFYNFPDNRFDSISLLEVVKAIESIKAKIKPNIIFTHYSKDLNKDHRIVYKAVITATRPIPGETVKEIYSFEVLSSTEWDYPASFSPDTFFDINKTLSTKLSAMAVYKSELRQYPHPRSLKGVSVNAAYWGMRLGLRQVEAFKSIRVLK